MISPTFLYFVATIILFSHVGLSTLLHKI